MEELSSQRNISLKIEKFDINSEDSQNESNIAPKFIYKSFNFIQNEEKHKNIDINLDEEINQQKMENEQKKSNKDNNTENIENKEQKSNKSSKINETFFYKKEILENNEDNQCCLICENKLTIEESFNNFLNCLHYFCNSCYFDYLKEKINNNIVDKIKCLEYDCDNILFDNFIQNHLKTDIPLLEKYLKLKKRRQLLLDPNIQLCPFPNCESYASKNEKNNYVTCLKGHKFCFNCLKDWHGKEKCKIEIDSNFEKWKKSKNVKRCPNCKYFVEKGEGCNHMTCANCKYEWCWYCLKESLPGHFDDGGNCAGLQYTKCQCFSNRFCVFLYQFLLQILGIIKFDLLLPFYFIRFLNEKVEDINKDAICFFKFFIIFSFFIIVFVYGVYVMIILSVIMTFYWPLKRKMLELLGEID